MNSVEIVKELCKNRKIPISKLEKDCGFSNGYIRGLKRGDFPSDRLVTIAKYLDMPIEYLLHGILPDPVETQRRMRTIAYDKGLEIPQYTPDPEGLKQIARYLGVTLDFLVNGEQKYGNDDVELATRIRSNAVLKELFDVAVKSRPEDVKIATMMLKRMSAYSRALNEMTKPT